MNKRSFKPTTIRLEARCSTHWILLKPTNLLVRPTTPNTILLLFYTTARERWYRKTSSVFIIFFIFFSRLDDRSREISPNIGLPLVNSSIHHNTSSKPINAITFLSFSKKDSFLKHHTAGSQVDRVRKNLIKLPQTSYDTPQDYIYNTATTLRYWPWTKNKKKKIVHSAKWRRTLIGYSIDFISHMPPCKTVCRKLHWLPTGYQAK